MLWFLFFRIQIFKLSSVPYGPRPFTMCSECRLDSIIFVSCSHDVEPPDDGVMPKHVAAI